MIRRWWPDRNPLRRTADRVEAAVFAVLLAAFLAGVPLAVLAATGQEAAGGMRAERAQQGWRQVGAVLLQDVPERAHARFQASPEPLAKARWRAPDGVLRKGEVYAPGGARSGTSVMVWTNGLGELEGVPVQSADVSIWEMLAGLTAAVLATAVLAATGFLARWVLDRRRLAGWDEEWSHTGPQWTGRL